MASTMRRQIASPSPVPPNFRVTELSAWTKGSKIALHFSLGMPTPVSITSKTRCDFALLGQIRPSRQVTTTPALAKATIAHDPHVALDGELDGIADEIDEQLPQASGIGQDRLRHALLPAVLQGEAFLVGADAEHRDHVGQDLLRRARHALDFQLARLDLRKVQARRRSGPAGARRWCGSARGTPAAWRRRRRLRPFAGGRRSPGWRSAACGFRGSCWPGIRSWRGWRPGPRRGHVPGRRGSFPARRSRRATGPCGPAPAAPIRCEPICSAASEASI